MIIKQGVSIAGLQKNMQIALNWCEEVYEQQKLPLVITSAFRDEAENRLIGGHPMSKHLFGHAFDCRIPPDESKKYIIFNKLILGLEDLGFQVILEPTHIHIEYDPK